MSTDASVIVGLDVAKAKIDVALLIAGKFKSKVVANSAAGFAGLTAWLSKQGVIDAVFLMEATGIYHEAVAQFLADQGSPVFVVNPARIKRYAQASMLRGKTDAADARVIASSLLRSATHSSLGGLRLSRCVACASSRDG